MFDRKEYPKRAFFIYSEQLNVFNLFWAIIDLFYATEQIESDPFLL